MRKPKYFKGSKKKSKKALKEPVVVKDTKKQFSSKAIFPKNSRPIPEKVTKRPSKVRFNIDALKTFLKKKQVWLEAWNVFGVILLVFLGISMFHLLQELGEKNAQRQVIVDKLSKWEQVAQTHPGYRDVYLQMASLAYALGEQEKARLFVEKALSLDPNNETAIKLQGEIVGKR